MKILVKKAVGKVQFEFEVEAEKGFDALFNASTLAATPDVCGLCKSTDVVLTGNRAKEYKFVKVRCTSCTATSTLSEYKAGGYFWKEFEKYAQRSNGTGANQSQEEAPPPGDNDF